jgi:hypothetical protein
MDFFINQLPLGPWLKPLKYFRILFRIRGESRL